MEPSLEKKKENKERKKIKRKSKGKMPYLKGSIAINLPILDGKDCLDGKVQYGIELGS
jgi:hypothetical protein